MLKTHILLAFRHLRKEKGYTLVSILGLALAFTACFFTLSFIVHEYSADGHFADPEHTFQLKSNDSYDSPVRFSSLPTSNATYLEENFPETKLAVPVFQERGEIELSWGGKVFQEQLWVYTEAEFTLLFEADYFSISYPFQPGTVLISESVAQKIFGSTAVAGQVLALQEGNYTVAGTFRNFPSNSHLHPEFLAVPLPEKELKHAQGMVFVQVKPGADVEALNKKIDAAADKMDRFIDTIHYHLVSVKDIYFDKKNSNGLTRYANVEMIRMMAVITLIILFISGFNIVNLTQVKALFRGREVGVKKVLGITYVQLFSQFLLESAVVVVLSVLLALSLVQLSGAAVANYLNMERFSSVVPGSTLMLLMVATIVILAVMQTLVFTRVMPRQVMSGSFKVGERKWLLKSLVALQFVIACVLIGGTLLVDKQMRYIMSKPLGFAIDNLWYLEVPSQKVDLRLLKQKLAAIPEIEDASVSSGLPFVNHGGMINRTDKGMEFIPFISVDKDFISTFGIAYVDQPLTRPDSGLVVNQQVLAKEDFDVEKVLSGKLLGSVEDFHYSKLSSSIGLMVLSVDNPGGGYLTVRIQDGQEAIARQKMAAAWEQLYPDRVFELQSLFSRYLVEHRSAIQLAFALKALSLVAVFISCIGLASLTGFFVRKRYKEIAIRKVLGASVEQVIRQVNIPYLLIISLAVAGSACLIYYLGNEWLADFAYATTIDALILAVPGLVLLLVSGSIMIRQTWSTARANPVEALRTE